jgi:L-ribulose-5-phosphate 4-epimerase
MNPFADLQARALACNRRLPESGLVSGTFGNASAFDRDRGVFAIKPSGVAFADLRDEDMPIVDLTGKTVAGRLRPSSDTPTHAMLYEAWPDIGGVVHTHSPYAVAWAQAMRPIPVFGTTHADYIAGDIPCTAPMGDDRIAGNYEVETGRQILDTFTGMSHHDAAMVLVACHGPFTWGRTPEEAVANSIALEMIARMALYTIQINPGTARLKPALLKKHFERKHGPDAYYGQDKTNDERTSR